MTTEYTPKPVAWMIRNKGYPQQQPWPTRVDSDAYFVAHARSDYEATPLFDQATIEAAVAKERERCAAILRAWGAATWQPNEVRDAADQMLGKFLGPNV